MFKLPWRKKQTQVSEIVSLVDKLKTSSFDYYYNVYSSDISLIKLTAIEPTIVQYIKLINYIISCFRTDTILNLSKVMATSSSIYLRDWFLNEKNEFIDPQYYIDEFISKCIELLLLFEEKKALNNPSFNTAKNLMFSQNVINDIIDICKGFLK